MSYIRTHRGYRRLILGQLCLLVAVVVGLQWARQFRPNVSGYSAFSYAQGQGLANGEMLNPNTATTQEWESLPGIGPTLAERIVLHRQNAGAFTTLGDLRKVRGLGPYRVRRIKGYLEFGSVLDNSVPGDIDLQ